MKKRQKKQQQTKKVFKRSAFWKRDRRESNAQNNYC